MVLGSLVFASALLVGANSERRINSRIRTSGEAIFRVPASTSEIVLDRQGSHLFLAEYERTLIVRTDGEEVLSMKAADDSGGYSRMRLYQISPTEFYLEGFLSYDRYFLDISKPSARREVLSPSKPAGARFVGVFDKDEHGWRFTQANEQMEEDSHR